MPSDPTRRDPPPFEPPSSAGRWAACSSSPFREVFNMPAGPGKYDDACETVRQITGGTVLLIVHNGNKGNGFSFTTTNPTDVLLVPELLRAVADMIDRDGGV